MPLSQPIRDSIVISEPAAVAAALAELGPGLTIEALQEALLGGIAAGRGANSNVPARATGGWRWGKATGELRDNLIPSRWTPFNSDHLEGVRSPDGEHVILITAGNENTGVPDATRPPKTKYKKGTMTRAAVSRNQKQTTIFERLALELDVAVPPPTYLTWHLLSQLADGRLLCELSLAAEESFGYINRWRPRLVLPPRELGSLDPGTPIDLDPSAPIDLEIEPNDSL